jgi:hypothetical protein
MRLGSRSACPAWGPELLARAQMVQGVQQLTVIYDDWERWSADVAESHSSYPSLLRFRSPEPHSSLGSFAAGRARRRRSLTGGLPGERAVHGTSMRADGLRLPAETEPHAPDPSRRGPAPRRLDAVPARWSGHAATPGARTNRGSWLTAPPSTPTASPRQPQTPVPDDGCRRRSLPARPDQHFN